MDIFVRNLPSGATRRQVESFFAEPLRAYGIDTYHCEKFAGKGLALITVLDANAAILFLQRHGDNTFSTPGVKKRRLQWGDKLISCSKGRTEPSRFSIEALKLQARDKNRQPTRVPEGQGRENKQNAKITRFAICKVQCGNWEYSGGQLAFTEEFKVSRQGTVSFGVKEALILLGGQKENHRRILINYQDCNNIVLGGYDDPSITFSLRIAPRFYEVLEGDVLSDALSALVLGEPYPKKNKVKKSRLTGIDDTHSEIAGMCLVYRVLLSNYQNISIVQTLLRRIAKAPTPIPLSTQVTQPTEKINRTFTRLSFELTDQRRYGSKPFNVLYQLDGLARGGILPPSKVIELLPTVSHIYDTHGLDATLSALRRFNRQVLFPGPETEAHQLSTPTLQKALKDLATSYEQFRYNPENPYELSRRYVHINLIHKIIVTPCGVYLSGPEPEPTNRVLRRYSTSIDNFARVVFQDEDGASVRYDPQASQDIIFHERFKGILDRGILIAGKMFSFLGFSHSSLRSQSCWFMAPIFSEGSFKLPDLVLKELGDFSNIRVPAKCAARIGQNFTDTNATVDLKPTNVSTLDMVVRNGRDFGDGVGTISGDLLRRVWQVYGRKRLLKPTALQIRFQGSKGMVSLDSRLSGQRLLLRDNMNKFSAPNAWNLEICGAAFKPLPMVLNRQFIKIFEDLGIPPDVFMDLQKTAVDKLRFLTASAINTANFLEEMDCARATLLPSLLRSLSIIGLDYRQDQFLYSVVEMAVVTKLRDIKYRGRIPVDSGVTLYGIMDETGELQEGQIFVVTERSPEGGRNVLVKNRVVVTRSPCMHPGDLQVVDAVNVREDSPLQKLSNVVVFSQHGQRDLPSMLSGGDLDGDLYNILYDPRLIPQATYEAADYPRVSAVELDRPVTSKDMSDFLVTFMESDLLGMLSNVHMQLADQYEEGTFHPDCIKLASLASTAVDFSKTGIPVNMRDCPKYNRFRPDFMAPSPRMVVSEGGQIDLDDNEDDYDDAFEGLDAERRGMRYYESQKVLGRLYREIDERQFLSKMHHDHRIIAPGVYISSDVLRTLLGYMKQQATRYGLLYDHQKELAKQIRAGYEESLLELLYFYAPSPRMPVSEQEAFAGTILGRSGGAQGKPLRELSKTMRERFEAVVEYTVARIVKGDDEIRNATDLDVLYDDRLDREVEALPRALACLHVAVEEHGSVDKELGELHSFKYIAAGVCLRELERYRLTTFGSYVLPRIGSY